MHCFQKLQGLPGGLLLDIRAFLPIAKNEPEHQFGKFYEQSHCFSYHPELIGEGSPTNSPTEIMSLSMLQY